MSSNPGSIGNIRKKFYETHEFISTAYHEAGHTIYGLLHHVKVESVSVFIDKKSKRIEGFTHYDDNPELANIKDPILLNDRLHTEIGLSYSGLVAEKRYFRMISGSDKFPMFLREGSSNDINSAAALFQKYNLIEAGRKRYNYKKKMMKLIDQELLENWDAISAVAHALFKKNKINYLELQEVLTKKTEHRKFWKEQFKSIDSFYENIEALDEKHLKYILSL